MNASVAFDRALILAPHGRDASVASQMLREAGISHTICGDLSALVKELEIGAGLAVVAEEAIRAADVREIARWIAEQPSWSDFPFVLLTERSAGLERNPMAARLMELLGNTTFVERPFHPTTLISIVRTASRGRQRQYQSREQIQALAESEATARRAEEQLQQLNETLEARVEERTKELAAANRQLFSQIEERERVESTLHQMQRLEAVGQLTSGVAHDFNNLLTVVLGNIAFVERHLRATGADAKLQQRLAHMRTAAERGAKLTAQLLAFSRRQKLSPKPVDLNEMLAGMRDLLQSTLGGSVQIKTLLKQDLWLAFVDPTQIELAVLNLAINARDAMDVGGALTIETGNVSLGPPERAEEPAAGEYVMIAVTDQGTGMTTEVLGKAFEPFFTTKEVGKGSGLGLSQVLGFVKQTGGGVRVQTRVGEGTTFRIYLPRAGRDGVAEVGQGHLLASTSMPLRASILLIDDDSAVREVVAAMLREMGHVVLEVGSGGATLDLLDQKPRIDLAIIDFAMPGMNGRELARQIQAKLPALPVLFVTGYVDTSALGDIREEQVVRKPFLGDELANKVRQMLSRPKVEAVDNVVPIHR